MATQEQFNQPVPKGDYTQKKPPKLKQPKRDPKKMPR